MDKYGQTNSVLVFYIGLLKVFYSPETCFDKCHQYYCVCEGQIMLEKLWLSIIITFSLNLFLQISTFSENNIDTGKEQRIFTPEQILVKILPRSN